MVVAAVQKARVMWDKRREAVPRLFRPPYGGASYYGRAYRWEQVSRSDMSPSFAYDDTVNVLVVNVEHTAQCGLTVQARSEEPPNLQDILLCELSGVLLLAPRATSLSDHIGLVDCCGTEEEMLGVNAGGVIAVVANEQSIRNRPDVKFVGESVCHNKHAPPVSKLPVAGAGSPALPKPASFRLSNVLPELGLFTQKRTTGPILVGTSP